MIVELGDYVKDGLSGFVGYAVARHKYPKSCDRITVQPKADKENRLPDTNTFDEPQLIIIKKRETKRMTTDKNHGGPDKYIDDRSSREY